MATIQATAPIRSKGLHIALWIAQVLLGAMFIMTGLMKLGTPLDQLATSLPWVNDFSPVMVKLIGAAEIAGGLGLILPSLLRIKPILTPMAAVGIILIMVFASLLHMSRGENGVIGMNIALAAIAAFIAWGRFKKAPISPK